MDDKNNVDQQVVNGFGKEWKEFDQSDLPESEHLAQFNDYFAVFPWSQIGSKTEGFDAGCGSGRWAKLVAPKVGHLYCVDPSEAIEVAKVNLQDLDNCSFYQETISNMSFPDGSMDFGYSLGVLHHIPDTQQGLVDCVRKLKVGAPFLVYLYYAFDNQPIWYRWLWKLSDIARSVIWQLPHGLKLRVCSVIAGLVYFPLARFARIVEKIGGSVHSWPLSAYRNQSFYFMKTDALDRFGTKLEQRFTKVEITKMMKNAGLEHITFSSHTPFHCAVGIKI